jgi:predicted HicB family RNase H-like nuclease
MKLMQYNGYYGSADASLKDGTLYGKLEFISALVSYEGATVQELKQAFEDAVDDYLTTCKAKGYEPEIPCKGSFNIRIGHEIHLAAAVKARELGISLNDFVRNTISAGLAKT